MGTYSVKSDFPKTKSLNLYLLVSLPASLPQTDMPNSPACRTGKDPASPFFSPGLYRWIARSSKNPSRVLYSSIDARFHEFCTSCRRHVGHIATGSTCQAPNNSAEQQGTHPSRTAPVVVVMSNETSNHNAAPSQTDEATIISHFSSPSSQTTLYCFCLKRDTCIALVHHDTWDRMTGHAPPPIAR